MVSAHTHPPIIRWTAIEFRMKLGTNLLLSTTFNRLTQAGWLMQESQHHMEVQPSLTTSESQSRAKLKSCRSPARRSRNLSKFRTSTAPSSDSSKQMGQSTEPTRRATKSHLTVRLPSQSRRWASVKSSTKSPCLRLCCSRCSRCSST